MNPSLDAERHATIPNALQREVDTEIAKYFSADLAPVIAKMEEHYEAFRKKCETVDDIRMLDRLFRKVNMRGFDIYFPRKSVTLTVRQVVRLLDMGFRLDTEWSYYIETSNVPTGNVLRRMFSDTPPTRKTARVQDTGVEIPESEWDTVKVKRSFHPETYPELFGDYGAAKAALDAMYAARHSAEYAENYAEVAEKISGRLDDIIRNVPVPTLQELRNPVPLELRESVFEQDDGVLVSASLSERERRVISLQKNGLLPSIFNGESHETIGSKPQHVVLLLDKSGSTETDGLFKLIDLAAAQVERTLREHIRNLRVSIVTYSDTAETIRKITGFLLPGGGTEYPAWFSAAIGELDKKRGHKTVVHLSDGLPNDYESSLKSAAEFPVKNIRYGQIIYPHNLDAYRLSVQQKVLELLGWDWLSGMDTYEEEFYRIAQAAWGGQIVIPVPHLLADGVISAIDLGIGMNFLGDRSFLSQEEVDALLKWVSGNADSEDGETFF